MLGNHIGYSVELIQQESLTSFDPKRVTNVPQTTTRDIYDFTAYIGDCILNALTFLVPSIVNHGDERRLLVSGHVYILAHKMSSVNRETVSAFSSYPCYNGEWTNVGGLEVVYVYSSD